jgi:serine/threonine protein kinase
VVAVKILRPQSGPHAERWRARFLDEWGASSVVSHPNAVAVLDAGITAAGLAYLVMELLEGRSLAEELGRRGVLSLRRTAQVLVPVCRMLATAHEARLVHRDIKPANIFLHGPGGRAGEIVKVVDFGIAKLVESGDTEELTTLGRLVGTPMYMSAERLLGRPCDGRADVYAVAVTAYEALTGRPPFAAAEGTVAATILACLSAPLESPSRFRDDLPAAFEAVLTSALSRDPAERPRMGDLGDAFAALLDLPEPSVDTPEPLETTGDGATTVVAWPPARGE